jgi:signal transduction histidine kinase
MKMEIFTKKKDQYEERPTKHNSETSTLVSSFNCNGIEKTTFSLNDLVSEMLKNPNQFGSLTFELYDQESGGAPSEVDQNQYFVLQMVDHIRMNDEDCKMIQLIDISKTVQYDEAVQQRQFASMLNATVSHEMRGPISSISQSIEQNEREISGMRSEFEAFYKDVKELVKKVPKEFQKQVGQMKKFVVKCKQRFQDIDSLTGNMSTSSKLLGFYVQDLLDLAQIRTGNI